MRSRPGIALVLVLVLLVVLECTLLGVMESARQQRRIALNRTRLLEIQQRAEGAVRRALVEWPPAPLSDRLVFWREAGPVTLRHAFTPLPDQLVLVEAEAVAAAPARVRHTASLLAHPPVLALSDDPAAAVLTAATATVFESALVSGGPIDECSDGRDGVIRTAGIALVAPGATVGVRIDELRTRHSWPHDALERMAVDPTYPIAVGDSVVAGSSFGLLVARGSVTFGDGAGFRGLVIAGGDLEIAAGAVVTGATWIGGAARIRGTLRHDACAAELVIADHGLRRARPRSGRAWVPAF